MDHCSGVNISDLIIKATSIDDDIGTTLRIHLLCERLVEAWLCAHCDSMALFGTDKEKVKIECDSKIALAANLGLPKQITKTLKTINSLRNDIAHNSDNQGISDSRIQSMSASIGDYLLTSGEDIKKVFITFMDPNGIEVETVTLSSEGSKNRLKLCLIFMVLMRELMKVVASKHSGKWDNDFTQYDYNIKLNKPT
ncbi:hypothetical protein A8A01_03065 [Ewingella americana]|nr:hypothetical protein A8A01_03065 [Ewingella americana]